MAGFKARGTPAQVQGEHRGGSGMIRWLIAWWVRISLRVFFRSIEIRGRHNLPAEGPLLIMANHVNALADGLLLATHLQRPVKLTAKSTLTSIMGLGLVMRLAGVIPIRRRGDAGEDPTRNSSAFDTIFAAWGQGEAVLLFAEGQSHNDPAMRPFRTGAARLLREHIEAGDAGGLQIVPIGLSFDHKGRFRSRGAARIGAPRPAAEWLAGHGDADVKELTAHLQAEVRAVTAEFDHRHEAELFAWAADLLLIPDHGPAPVNREDTGGLAERVAMVQRLRAGRSRLRERDPELLAEVEASARDLQASFLADGIDPKEVMMDITFLRSLRFFVREMTQLIVGGTLASLTLLAHLPAWALTWWRTTRAADEEDHHASHALLYGMAFVPAFALLEVGLVWWFLGPLMAGILAAILVIGPFQTLPWLDRMGAVRRRSRTWWLFTTRPQLHSALYRETRALIEIVRSLDSGLD